MPSSLSSDSSTKSNTSASKRIKVHILQAKFDPATVDELYALIDSRHSGGSLEFEHCGDASNAHIIVTNIHMRKRLERHLDWNIAVRSRLPVAALILSLLRFLSDRRRLLRPSGFAIPFSINALCRVATMLPWANSTMRPRRTALIAKCCPASANIPHLRHYQPTVLRSLLPANRSYQTTMFGTRAYAPARLFARTKL